MPVVYYPCMKVVLLKDIKNLGAQGDICEVGDGYALNFLIPRSDALPENDTQAGALLRKHAEKNRRREADAAAAKELASRVPSAVTMRMPVNDSGKLFQAVTPAVLCGHLEKNGGDDGANITVPERWFSFAPIKEVGEHTVTLSADGEEKAVTLIIERES